MKIKTRRAMVIIQDDGSHLSSIAVSWRRWRKSPSVCLVISYLLSVIGLPGYQLSVCLVIDTKMITITIINTINNLLLWSRLWSQGWLMATGENLVDHKFADFDLFSPAHDFDLTSACRQNRSHWSRFSNQSRRHMPWCWCFDIDYVQFVEVGPVYHSGDDDDSLWDSIKT